MSYPDVSTLNRDLQIGRENWRQAYGSTEVAAAAEKAAVYHRSRQVWWEGERETTKAKLGTEGLDVREQPVTGGVQHQVVLDPTLTARLNECETKIRSHRTKAERLDQWVGFLKLQNRPVVLTFDDVEFFEIGRHG